MKYYFVANIKIDDPNEYQKYLNEADEIFSKYNGKYLALDDSPVVLEGKWEYSRVVIIEFQSKSEFNKWYKSEDYPRILQYRLRSADCDTILIKGS